MSRIDGISSMSCTWNVEQYECTTNWIHCGDVTAINLMNLFLVSKFNQMKGSRHLKIFFYFAIFFLNSLQVVLLRMFFILAQMINRKNPPLKGKMVHCSETKQCPICLEVLNVSRIHIQRVQYVETRWSEHSVFW